MTVETVTASELGRNDRVVIHDDEMPYLVDSARDTERGTVLVAYSSGDVIEYAATDELTVIA